jgi:hypothetical protein
MPEVTCSTCKHFESSDELGSGWCRNSRLFAPSQSQPVDASELFCEHDGRDFWEAADDPDAQGDRRRRKRDPSDARYLEAGVPGSVHRPDSSDGEGQRSTERPAWDQSKRKKAGEFEQARLDLEERPEIGSIPLRPTKSQLQIRPGQERAVSYQPEERYWTDYLRIALPIVGLLLLLGVFWYWASSFIGDDTTDPPQTPVAELVTTPITAPTETPTPDETTQVEVQTVDPTEAAGVETAPTPPAQVTQPTPQPEVTPTPETEAPGRFEIDEIVIVNTGDVNMRAEPSTDAEIVDVLQLGAELRVLDDESVDANDFTWWNVEDTLNGQVGWVVDQFLDNQ